MENKTQTSIICITTNNYQYLHSAPAIQSKTLEYGHTELEKEHEEKHEEVEWTVTSVINKYQTDKHITIACVMSVFINR